MAEATALLLGGSDDSFSFATTSRARKSEPPAIDKSLPRDRGRSGDVLSAGNTSSIRTSEDNRVNERTAEDAEGLHTPTVFRHDDSRSTTSHPGDVGHESGTTLSAFAITSGKETSALGRRSTALAAPSTKMDSSDEADALLRLTDPDALTGATTGTSTTTPENVPSPSGADARNSGSRRSRFTALSSPTTDVTDTGTTEWGEATEAAPRRRSPSPPSHARRERSESPERSPRRTLASHGLTISAPGESANTAIGEKAERSERGPDYSVREGVASGASASSSRSKVISGNFDTFGKQTVGIGSVTEYSERTSHSLRSGGATNPAASTRGAVPRRSALAVPNKPRRREGNSRGVSFDDDLGDVDALDVLPGSDDDAPTPPSAAPSSPPTDVPSPSADHNTLPIVSTGSTNYRRSTAGVERLNANGDAGRLPISTVQLATNPSASQVSRSAQRSMPITAGLSPAAARLMAEDSSSGEDQSLAVSQNADLDSRLGLGTSVVTDKAADSVVRTPAVLPDASDDDAKLDLVLGFTPSAMDGDRRQRRSIPTGGRRRPCVGDSLKTGENRPEVPTPTAQGSVFTPTTVTTGAAISGAKAGAPDTEHAFVAERAHEISPGRSRSRSLQPKSTAQSTTSDGPAVDKDVSAASAILAGDVANSLPAVTSGRPAGPVEETASPNGTGGSGGSGAASGTGSGKTRVDTSPHSSRPRKCTSGSAGTVDASVLSSLERQLVVLTNEREATTARFLREEQRLEQEATASKVAAADAEARVRDADSALVAARFG